MFRQLSILLAASTLCLQASTIDLRSLAGNFQQGEFGQPDTQLYAQSITADDVFFNQARVEVQGGSSDVLFNILITGARSDSGGGFNLAPDLSDVLFTSGEETALGGGSVTEFTVNPNLPVSSGDTYFIVLDARPYASSGDGSVLATQFNAASNPYPNHEFVFFNSTDGDPLVDNWAHRAGNNEDLAILASFSPSSSVPEPGTFGLAAFGLFLAWRARRKFAK